MFVWCCGNCCLTAEAVEGAALPLQGIDHIHGSDGLPLGMLGVGDSITDDILQEDLKKRYSKHNPSAHNYLENTPSLLVDEPTDPFDTTPPCKSPDRRLGDTLPISNQQRYSKTRILYLDVVPQHLAMSLGTSFAQAFTSFASSSHCRQIQLSV